MGFLDDIKAKAGEAMNKFDELGNKAIVPDEERLVEPVTPEEEPEDPEVITTE